ncbi:MAG: thrombospondin type 3 repeat-containing protein [Pseudomonadales bacterium]|nr:thrombospondin type 3 repeat-containing protein [Pseudomonadales bacterium]
MSHRFLLINFVCLFFLIAGCSDGGVRVESPEEDAEYETTPEFILTFSNGIPVEFQLSLNGNDVTPLFDVAETGAIGQAPQIQAYILEGANTFYVVKPEGIDPVEFYFSTPQDIDGDGISDSDDLDIDGDGISNIYEEQAGTDPLDVNSVPDDFDGDGIPDVVDADMDNDGIANAEDAFPRNPIESSDLDNDGIGDNSDADRDGDGISNAYEIQVGTDPNDSASIPIDLNGDGVPDSLEQSPSPDAEGIAYLGVDVNVRVMEGGGRTYSSSRG